MELEVRFCFKELQIDLEFYFDYNFEHIRISLHKLTLDKSNNIKPFYLPKNLIDEILQ